jgi:hypothetical protein
MPFEVTTQFIQTVLIFDGVRFDSLEQSNGSVDTTQPE